ALNVSLLDNRNADVLRTRFDLQTDIAGAVSCDDVHSSAIDGDLEFLVAAYARLRYADAGAGDPEIVFTIQGENVVEQDSASRTERQSFDMIALDEASRNTIGHFVAADFRIANRKTADLRSSSHVGLNKLGRHAQNVGYIVEAFARIVCWKERCGIN